MKQQLVHPPNLITLPKSYSVKSSNGKNLVHLKTAIKRLSPLWVSIKHNLFFATKSFYRFHVCPSFLILQFYSGSSQSGKEQREKRKKANIYTMKAFFIASLMIQFFQIRSNKLYNSSFDKNSPPHDMNAKRN